MKIAMLYEPKPAVLARQLADRFDLIYFNMQDYAIAGHYEATGQLHTELSLIKAKALHTNGLKYMNVGLHEVLSAGDNVLVCGVCNTAHLSRLVGEGFALLTPAVAELLLQQPVTGLSSEIAEAVRTQNSYLAIEQTSLMSLTEPERTNKLRETLMYLAGEAYEAISMLDKPNRTKPSVFSDAEARSSFAIELADVQLYLFGVLAYLGLNAQQFEQIVTDKRKFNESRKDHQRIS